MIEHHTQHRQAALLQRFVRHFAIPREAEPLRTLQLVINRFANLPYENLTKIIKLSVEGSAARARRSPVEVLEDHIRYGTGGTCFSLTATCRQLLYEVGFDARPILADRHYGHDTHCALLLSIQEKLHLLDPGYLINTPVPVPAGSVLKLQTPFNDLLLEPLANSDKVQLFTVTQGQKTWRLTYKIMPVNEAEFARAWEQSFGWDMMRYPVLTQVQNSRQCYLQGTHFRVRGRRTTEKRALGEQDVGQQIIQEFDIDRRVVVRALRLLKNRGEFSGGS